MSREASPPSTSELAPKPMSSTPEARPFLSGNRGTTAEMTPLYTKPTPMPEMAKETNSSQMRCACRNMQSTKPMQPSMPPMGMETRTPRRLATAPPKTPPRQKLASITVKQAPSWALDQPKPAPKGME